jgi:hypothetical protein
VQERTAELRESEARFRSLTELASDWYWEQDEAGPSPRSRARCWRCWAAGETLAGDRPVGDGQSTAGLEPRRARGPAATIAARQPFLDFCSTAPGRRLAAAVPRQRQPMFNQSCRFLSATGASAWKSWRKWPTMPCTIPRAPVPNEPEPPAGRAAPREFQRLAPNRWNWVPAPGRNAVRAGRQLRHAYFPTTAIVSLHYVTESGASAETAGGQRRRGGRVAVHGRRHHAQLGRGADRGPRLPAGPQGAHAGVRRARPVAALLLRYTQALMTQMAQTGGLQPPPFGGAAAVPLAAADAGPAARPANWS